MTVSPPISDDIRARPYQHKTLTGSNDLQTVEVALRVLCRLVCGSLWRWLSPGLTAVAIVFSLLFRPDPNQLPKIYRTLGYSWEQRVLPSITYGVVGEVISKFTASQLFTKRQAEAAVSAAVKSRS